MSQASVDIKTSNHVKKCSVTDEDRAFYKENGYLIIRNVLSEKECDDYIEEAHRVCKGTLQEPNIYRKSDKFLEMLRDQRIMDYADSLLEWKMIPIQVKLEKDHCCTISSILEMRELPQQWKKCLWMPDYMTMTQESVKSSIS